MPQLHDLLLDLRSLRRRRLRARFKRPCERGLVGLLRLLELRGRLDELVGLLAEPAREVRVTRSGRRVVGTASRSVGGSGVSNAVGLRDPPRLSKVGRVVVIVPPLTRDVATRRVAWLRACARIQSSTVSSVAVGRRRHANTCQTIDRGTSAASVEDSGSPSSVARARPRRDAEIVLSAGFTRGQSTTLEVVSGIGSRTTSARVFLPRLSPPGFRLKHRRGVPTLRSPGKNALRDGTSLDLATLTIEELQSFLDRELEEGLTWEAKGSHEIRSEQVRKAVWGSRTRSAEH